MRADEVTMILPEVLVYAHAAREWVDDERRRRRDARVRDARGRTVDIAECRPDDWEGLLSMYRSVDPAQCAPGMPPLGDARQAVWLDELLRRGTHVVARSGGRIVGHALSRGDGTGPRDVLVFTHRDFARAGIDDALLRALLRRARRETRRARPAEAPPANWARTLLRRLRAARAPERRPRDAAPALAPGIGGRAPARSPR